ncbi:MAG: M14 family metallopeptidase [Planctomycetota bacterium]|nr:M14 family metallopeptidase [Planctomycetota bacterium]
MTHLLMLLFSASVVAATPHWPRTSAEESGYRATMRHADVVAFADRLADLSPLVTRTSMGRSFEGRDLPLLIVADPPVSTPEQATASGKLVIYLQGNIHAGEVCGKEALLMFARDLASAPDAPENRRLLERAIFLIAPIYNADGNERVSADNRPGQVGPELGMGQRPNAQGLDLNRDHVKLESPEARALVRLLTAWNPHLTIDTHTTNGSHHRYTLTYEAPLNPSGHAGPIGFARDSMLPEVSRRLEARTGYRTFFYGNFDRAHSAWYTYSADPRFGTPYRGLRNRLSILSEAYAYAPYQDRVLCTLEFVRECTAFVCERADEVKRLLDEAEQDTVRAGQAIDPEDQVGIRFEFAAFDEPVDVLGYEMEFVDGRRPTPTDVLKTWRVPHYGRFAPTRSVVRPLGYIVPSELTEVARNLHDHGILIHRLDHDAAFEGEAASIDSIERAERTFQGHRLVSVETTSRAGRMEAGEGDLFVPTAQPLGNLVVLLLEPESQDGLTTWGFVDGWLEEGAEHPVVRVMSPLREPEEE